jgi:hypothetical protein
MYSKWPTIGIRCSIWYDARVPLLSFSAFLSQCSYRWPSNILKKRPPWLHLPERCSMVTCQSPLLYLRSLNFYCYSSNMQSCHCLLFRKKNMNYLFFVNQSIDADTHTYRYTHSTLINTSERLRTNQHISRLTKSPQTPHNRWTSHLYHWKNNVIKSWDKSRKKRAPSSSHTD